MTTTQNEIAGWFNRGVADKYAYMIVWRDTYDWSDYPSYYPERGEAQEALDNPSSMQRAMEVYDLQADRAPQLSASRSWALRRSRS